MPQSPLPIIESRSWKQLLTDRAVFSWCLFDWANRSFATTVMAGFFPIFFKQFWSAGVDPRMSTYQLGEANSLSSAVLAVVSPMLGAMADRASGQKAFLILFSFLGVVTTAALALVAKGEWQLAVFFYVLASIGFAGSNTFCDSLMIFIARPSEMNRVSALGFAFGYLGGGLLFAVNVWMTLKPALFGLRDATQAVQVSFVIAALWWAVFTIPLALYVHEEKRADAISPFRIIEISRRALAQMRDTFREVRAHRPLALYLLSYFFYIDGVNTIIRMAVDYGLALGFSSQNLIVALLMTQFVAFPAAIAYGQLAHKIGAKTSLFISIAAYVGVTIFAYFMSSAAHFYLIAFIIGCFQGGIQALSRSVFAYMTPKEKSGEFFGFFNMLGKFSSMVGPWLMGWASIASGDSRISVLSLIPLFLLGAVLLIFVPSEYTRPGGARGYKR